MLWVCLSSLRTGEFFRIKNKRNGAQHRQIPEENLVQSLGDEFTFQQNNNLKHKAKSLLELLTKKQAELRVST